MNLDELTPLELVRLMNAEDAQAVAAVATQAEAIARAIGVITERLRAGGRLVYIGAGTSGRLGVLDAAECPPTFSSPPEQVVGLIAGGTTALTQAVEGAEDHPNLAVRDLEAIGISDRDVLVGIATSGRTPYVLGAVGHARKLGAFTVGFACNPDSELEAAVDLAITPVVGPEVLSGSTRLKAGTATKLVLNMLSTGAMVGLGKTFGNLMIDLRATNSKLRARANRIVRFLTGLSVEASDALLQQCGGELKTALVVRLGGLAPEAARARLAAMGGQVRQALAGLPRAAERKPAAPAGAYYLGIDGGGTSTVALLAAPSDARPGYTVLGRGQAGSSNLQAVGQARALQALDAAIAAAFTAAGLPRQRVAAACFGLAGAGRPEDQEVIHRWAQGIQLAERLEVTTDAALLLAAGTPDGWGLTLIAGTGSIAFGRAPDGRTARAGGWGYILGDEGSGYALARGGLQAVVRAADGRGPATLLTDRLLARVGLTRPEQLVGLVYRGSDRAFLASLAPLVLDAADAGDAVAARLVAEGARELAETARAVAGTLGLEAQAVPLALAGGLLLESERYRTRVLAALAASGLRADPVQLVQLPAEGAVRLARAGGR